MYTIFTISSIPLEWVLCICDHLAPFELTTFGLVYPLPSKYYEKRIKEIHKCYCGSYDLDGFRDVAIYLGFLVYPQAAYLSQVDIGIRCVLEDRLDQVYVTPKCYTGALIGALLLKNYELADDLIEAGTELASIIDKDLYLLIFEAHYNGVFEYSILLGIRVAGASYNGHMSQPKHLPYTSSMFLIYPSERSKIYQRLISSHQGSKRYFEALDTGELTMVEHNLVTKYKNDLMRQIFSYDACMEWDLERLSRHIKRLDKAKYNPWDPFARYIMSITNKKKMYKLMDIMSNAIISDVKLNMWHVSLERYAM